MLCSSAILTLLQTEGGLRVFVSYSRHDIAFRSRLIAALEESGFECSYDQSPQNGDDPDASLSAQDEWWKQLKVMIAAADAIVFVVSPSSAASRVCDDEIAHARNLGKRIVPVLWREIDFSTAPERLRALNVSISFIGSDFIQSVARLRDALLVDVEWLRRATRLMRQAQDWLNEDRPEWRLLRFGAIVDADEWIDRRPPGVPPPGPLLIEFIEASRQREVTDKAHLDRLDSDQRRFSGLRFVGPAHEAFERGRYTRAFRLGCASVAVSEDWGLSLIPERRHARIRRALFEDRTLSFDWSPEIGELPMRTRIFDGSWVRDLRSGAVVWRDPSETSESNHRGSQGWLDETSRYLARIGENTISIVDLAEGTIQFEVAADAGKLSKLAVDSSGTRLVQLGQSGVTVWDTKSKSVTEAIEDGRSAFFESGSNNLIIVRQDSVEMLKGRRRRTLAKGRFSHLAGCSSSQNGLIALGESSVPDGAGRIRVVLLDIYTGTQSYAVMGRGQAPRQVDLCGTGELLLVHHGEAFSVFSVSSKGRELIKLHERRGRAAAIRADGRVIASLDQDGSTLTLWEPFSGELITEFPVMRGAADLAFDKTGRTLAIRCSGGLQVMDASVCSILDDRIAPKVFRGRLSTNAARMVSTEAPPPIFATADGTRAPDVDRTRVTVWDIQSGVKLGAFSGDGRARSAVLSPAGEKVAWAVHGSDDVFLARIGSANEAVRLKHAGHVISPEFSPDGAEVVTANPLEGLKIWNASDGKLVQKFANGEEFIAACFAGNERIVGVTTSGALIALSRGPEMEVLCRTLIGGPQVEFKPADHEVYLAGGYGSLIAVRLMNRLIIWDMSSDVHPIILPGEGTIRFTPCGRAIVCVTSSRVQILDSQTGEEIAAIQIDDCRDAVIIDSERLVVLTGSGNLQTYDLSRALGLTGPLLPLMAAGLRRLTGFFEWQDKDDPILREVPRDMHSQFENILSEAEHSAMLECELLLRSPNLPECYSSNVVSSVRVDASHNDSAKWLPIAVIAYLAGLLTTGVAMFFLGRN